MNKEVVNHLTWLTNQLSQIYMYSNCSNELKAQEINEGFNRFYKSLGSKKYIDFKNITREEASELRFGKWSEEQPNLWLFPLWIVPLIPDGMTVYGLDGKPFKYEKEKTDNDIRFGCVAYGILIDEEDNNNGRK